jgi:serine/threonine-protein kinase
MIEGMKRLINPRASDRRRTRLRLTLTPGSRIGIYEVTGQIGAGGMGEVYRAIDTNLKRSVAIKVLPPSVAADAERLARFQREAEVLATLNHSNIGAIYGLEKTADFTALVMELVEGDDLSQRIARGPIPLDEALPIAKQIADALEAAHEQGIIHRDLKPANIKVRGDGAVKVLDFGLAKAVAPQGASATADAMNSPTITTPAMTKTGMILGTAAYMAPEQARGKTVDRRADTWSFGVVVFEMLTGRRAFGGDDVVHTLALVMTKEPEWAALPSSTPPALRGLLRRCLDKDPKRRLQAIGDARVVIEDLISGASADDATGTPNPSHRSNRRPWSRALPWVVSAAALATTAVAVWSPWGADKPIDPPLVRLDVDLGADVSLRAPTSVGSSVAISADGTRLAYASGSPTRLFIRRLDQSKAVELPGTEGATVPFFSPDGQWVGFVSGGKANKISVDGGAVIPLTDVTNIMCVSWSEDGSIVISASRKVVRIPPGGGPPETVTEVRDGELRLLASQVLPGGQAILFAADNPGPVDKTTINVVTLADERKTLIQGGATPRFLATASGVGHLVYVRGATLFAVPFDLRTRTTRGTPVPMVDDVAHEQQAGVGQFDVSRTGTLVYRRAIDGSSVLTTFDANGKREPLQAKPGMYADLRLSPDGRRLAVRVLDAGDQDIFVYDLERDVMTRLTFGGGQYTSPAWSPDGRYVVFASVGNGILQARADGASLPQALTHSQTFQSPASFTPDGKRLAYVESLGGAAQLWTVSLTEEGGYLKAGTAERFLTSSANDGYPSFSPDGRWLAYASTESGATEVFVRAFPQPASGLGGRWQISTNGGTAPVWSRSGRDLFYQSGDQIMAASYAVTVDTFVPGKPRVWAPTRVAPGRPNTRAWDLAPDGNRVALLTPVDSSEGGKQEHVVVLLQNFFDELRRRVPLRK